MSEGTKQRGTYLFSILASLLKGRPLQILKQVDENNGYEALRQLICVLQPKSRGRALGLLTTLTQASNSRMQDPLLPQILDLEHGFKQYSQTADKEVSDDLKSAILLRSLSGQLRNFVAECVDENVSYEDLLELVLKYERSQQR